MIFGKHRRPDNEFELSAHLPTAGLPALHVLPVPHVLDGRTIRQSTKISRTCEAPPPYIPHNCFAERLIGSIRRECVDRVVALGKRHLRQVLKSYASYYNTARTHRSLAKDAPLTRPVQRMGRIVSLVLVGGLHHQYVRI